MTRSVMRTAATWGSLLVVVVATVASGAGMVSFAQSNSHANHVTAEANLVRNGSFAQLDPWNFIVRLGTSAVLSQDRSSVGRNRYSLRVDMLQGDSVHPWYVQLRQGGIHLTQGQALTLSFWARGSTASPLQAVLQQQYDPYSVYFEQDVNLTSSWRKYTFPYTPNKSDSRTLLAFNLAGATGHVWLDSVKLSAALADGSGSGIATPVPTAPPTPQSSPAAPTATPVPVAPPAATATTSAPPTVPGWNLIWNDEFNGTSLDTSKWNIESFDSGGYRTCCLGYGQQYYTPQDVTIGNGALRLTTERRSLGGYPYTSGAVSTKGKLDLRYGRIDIRARLPKTQGIWPALWLLPSSQTGYDAAFEIDMMELLGNDPHTVYMTNHWGGSQAQCAYTGPDFSAGFHVFTLEWTSSSLTWLVDGVQRCQMNQGVSNLQMFLMINTAVGGSWPGYPDASTALPQYFDVDYVRVYN